MEPTEDLAHPDLAATGAAMREEWRAEQEAATRDAAEDWQHRRTLRDRLVEHMHRGDRLAVSVVGQRFAGTPEEVGDDLLALRTLFGRVDIHLAPSIALWYEVYERASQGGSRGSDIAGGQFRRALELREREDSSMSVGTVFDPDGVDGRLTVGADHVGIVGPGGLETIVPVAQVAWITARRT
jgi:hypothetical protein